MAKVKTPRTTKPAVSKSKNGKKLLQMPENGNGNANAMQYSPADLEVEVRFRAYELYLQRGGAPGQEADDWFTAEREVLSRHDSTKHTA